MEFEYGDPQQPSVTCLECDTRLGAGTTKDVFSHLVVCLHVAPNTLSNIRLNAKAESSEHGIRVLHIVDALLPREE